jgi:Flp pilus assembly pilin Flp
MSYVKLWSHLLRVWSRPVAQKGQTLFEFALILALVALVALFALSALGLAVAGFFEPLPPVFGH